MSRLCAPGSGADEPERDDVGYSRTNGVGVRPWSKSRNLADWSSDERRTTWAKKMSLTTSRSTRIEKTTTAMGVEVAYDARLLLPRALQQVRPASGRIRPDNRRANEAS